MEMESEIFNALYTYTKALSVALGYRDSMTRLHSERVRGLSQEIGLRCGLTGGEISELGIAAAFHDIGKIGIPDSILLKTSRLDEADWVKMRQHCEIGEKIIASTELKGSQEASILVRHHHERYDGTGYPDKLSGNDIPICARIISIADNYDAMAVTRSYHHARAHEGIMDVMHRETGKKHDPEVMRVFREVIESSPFKARPSAAPVAIPVR